MLAPEAAPSSAPLPQTAPPSAPTPERPRPLLDAAAVSSPASSSIDPTATVSILPVVPARLTPPVRADVQGARALRSYWEQLRGRNDVPPFSSLDTAIVSTSWPNSLMVSYSGGDMSIPQIARLGRHTGEVEYTSMITEWILSCSREVARLHKPLEKEERFPGERRRTSYRMLLLPFASSTGRSDHILCHLTAIE